MFIKTQDRKTLINLKNVAMIDVESCTLYAYSNTENSYGDTWIKIGEFQNKDNTIDELNRIQDWIEQSTKNVYEVTSDSNY